jgi:putative ABC transport system permease protein
MIWDALWRTFIGRDLKHNKIRTMLTIFGIALGVAVMLAIRLANYTALEQFQAGIDAISGRSNLELRSTNSSTIDEKLYSELFHYWKLGVQATPVLEQTAVIVKDSESTNNNAVVHVLGMDMFQEPQFRDYSWVKGQEPNDLLTIFNRNHVYITETLASAHKLKRGDRFEVSLHEAIEPLFVAGILKTNYVTRAYGGQLILMDISTLQSAARLNGKLHRIELIVPEQQLKAVKTAIERDVKGRDIVVSSPKMRGQNVAMMLQAFQSNLTALSFIAMLVGMFLIYNTLSITVLRRRGEIATLRALGVSKQKIVGLFAGEVFLLGGLGCAFGCILGIGLAQLSLGAISDTIQTIYTGTPVTQLNLSVTEIIGVFVLGMLFTLIATLQPLWEAMSIPPALGVRPASFERRISRYRITLLWLSLGLGVLAIYCAILPPVQNLPVFGFMSAFIGFFAAAFLLPALLEFTLPVLANLLKQSLGLHAHIAARQLLGALGRSSIAVASLMVGIAMMMSLGIMIHSFRGTVTTWIHQTLKADIYIEPAARTITRQAGGLSLSTVKQIQNTPGIVDVDRFIEFPIEYNGRPAKLAAGDFNILFRRGQLHFTEQDTMNSVWEHLQAKHRCIISEVFALKHGLKRFESITLQTPSGPTSFYIAGIYYDYASENGYIVIPRQTYETLYQDRSISSLAVYTTPHTSPESIIQNILQRLPKQARLTIRSNRELREEVLRIFDRTFAITYALHLVAIAVAILSILNTLFALVIESKREFATLVCLGTARHRIQKIIYYQALLLASYGLLSGIILGILLSLLLVFVINRQSFGWSIQYAIPWDFILQSSAITLISALITAALPLRLLPIRFGAEDLRHE